MDRDSVLGDIRAITDEVLQLGGRGHGFNAETRLFGAIPEFDSMAVVSLLTAVEEHFGIVVEDDEITAETFETLGSLSEYVTRKLAS